MKRFILFLLFAAATFGATGDVSVRIRPDGWSADVAIEGFTSGATFNFGMGSNNTPTSSTPYLTVVSLGYDNTGAATTITRRVYLVPRSTNSVVRCPYSTATQAGGTWSGIFQDGETITCSTSGATAIVVGDQSSGAVIRYKNLSGTPLTTQTWTGGTSGATFVNTSSTVTTLTQPTNDELVTSTGIVVRVAFSDYVFQKDNSGGGNSGTAPTVTIPAAWATNSGGGAETSNALSGAAVTQDSTAAYPKVIANWTWPGNSAVTGNFTLRAFASHGTSVNDGSSQVSPGVLNIACIKFTAADTHSNTATTTVTAPTYDSSVGDAVPVVEWVATMDVSTLTALDVLTCNFIAYPLVGDSGSIIDTSAGTAAPTALFGPIVMLNDKADTYGASFAVVDPNFPDDVSGVVYSTSAAAIANAATTSYQKMATAYNALRTYNNTNYSRNNCSNSTMYLRTGNNAFVNGTVTVGTAPDTWLTIDRFPGDTKSGVIITNQVTGKSLGLKLKVHDVTITTTTAAGTFSPGGSSWLWLDKCDAVSCSSICIYQVKAWYLTRCTFDSMAQWFIPNSTENWMPAIIRGNTMTFTTGTANIRTYCLIGNLKTGNSTAGSFNLQRTAASSTAPVCENGIIAYNRFYGLNVSLNTLMNWAVDTPISHGQAIVQNVFENFKNNSSPMNQVAGDNAASTTDPNNNILIWNNTFMGQRQNFSYNDLSSNAPVRIYWSVKNNIVYSNNIKTDTFPTANGLRVQNWSDVNGVAWSGNLLGNTGGGFDPDFAGLKSITNNWSGVGASSYFAFTNYAAAVVGTSDGAGGGTYTLTAASPAIGLQRDYLIPYDIAGNGRSSSDAAGAYHYGTDTGFLFFFP